MLTLLNSMKLLFIYMPSSTIKIVSNLPPLFPNQKYIVNISNICQCISFNKETEAILKAQEKKSKMQQIQHNHRMQVFSVINQ